MAQTSAEAAAQALARAAVQLDEAGKARDRVKALTATVQAYEDGLAALRRGVRAATIRQTELSRKLAAQDGEIARLLGVLTSLGGGASAASLLHPEGPVGAARAGMLLSSVAPGLTAQAVALRSDLEEIARLRAVEEAAITQLRDGLDGAQRARSALSKAIADRTELPRKFTADPQQVQTLVASVRTLDSFASQLPDLAADEIALDLPPLDPRRGTLALPVSGTVLRGFNEADAAGVKRPGLVIATSSEALVTAPAAATILYHGPLLDYGLVSILEPQDGILIVLAGLSVAFGETGEVLEEGAPVGLMAVNPARALTPSSPSSEITGAARTETLYIEIRENNTPVDPSGWFATDRG